MSMLVSPAQPFSRCRNCCTASVLDTVLIMLLNPSQVSLSIAAGIGAVAAQLGHTVGFKHCYRVVMNGGWRAAFMSGVACSIHKAGICSRMTSHQSVDQCS